MKNASNYKDCIGPFHKQLTTDKLLAKFFSMRSTSSIQVLTYHSMPNLVEGLISFVDPKRMQFSGSQKRFFFSLAEAEGKVRFLLTIICQR